MRNHARNTTTATVPRTRADDLMILVFMAFNLDSPPPGRIVKVEAFPTADGISSLGLYPPVNSCWSRSQW